MLSTPILIAAAVVAYGFTTALVWRGLASGTGHLTRTTLALIGIALLCHGLGLWGGIGRGPQAGWTLGDALSLAGWVSAAAYLATATLRGHSGLGLVILPVALITAAAGYRVADVGQQLDTGGGLGLHLALAVPAYAVLCLAFAQACLIMLQEFHLRRPNQAWNLPALPAILAMESSLSILTQVGFLLVTINLIVGMISSYRIEGTLLQFNHHVLLSIMAWSGFGVLLLGRRLAGWRGAIAAKWTIVAFAMLVLAYFGTRFVNELVLQG